MSSFERFDMDQESGREKEQCSRSSKISLFIWIAVIILVESLSSLLTRSQETWRKSLNQSSITPPDIMFPIAWTAWYIMIAISGWMIFKAPSFPHLKLIKELYVLQLILNWSWTPLFFTLHLIGLSLLVSLAMVIAVSLIVYLAYQSLRKVSYLMTPYLLWIILATYLTFYIWQNN